MGIHRGAFRHAHGLRPHAETAQVWPRDGHIRVVGDLVGELGELRGFPHTAPPDANSTTAAAAHQAPVHRHLLLVPRDARNTGCAARHR